MKDKLRVKKGTNMIVGMLLIGVLGIIYNQIGCPIKQLTGMACPGCGMTRAAIALGHLDIKRAFHYQPLIFIMPFVVLGLWKIKQPKGRQILLIGTSVLLVVTYSIRMFLGNSEVVTFNPQEGILYNVFKNLNQFLF